MVRITGITSSRDESGSPQGGLSSLAENARFSRLYHAVADSRLAADALARALPEKETIL
jgi:hypothetical protein